MTSFLSFPKDGGPHSGASVGQALAGLVARDAAGMPRVGMLAAPEVKAVAASWKVQVGRFVYVHHVNGAIQFSGLSEAEQKDITPATAIPAGQSRIDRVVWDLTAMELKVLPGAVSASPVPPALGGMVPVGQVRVQSGDGMVVAARVTPDFARSAVAGLGETFTNTGSFSAASGLTVADCTVQVVGDLVHVAFRLTGPITDNKFLGYLTRDQYRPMFYTMRPAVSSGGAGRVRIRERGASTAGEVWYWGPQGSDVSVDVAYRWR